MRKNKLKIVYKIISAERQSSRDFFQKNIFFKRETSPQKNNHAEVQFQRTCFAILLKLYPRKDVFTTIRSTPALLLY